MDWARRATELGEQIGEWEPIERTQPAMVTGESVSLEEWANRFADDLVASGDAERGPVVDGKPTYRLTAQGERLKEANRRRAQR